MGLRVVSIEIEAIKKSEVDQLLYYYSDNNGESIANVILNIDLNSHYDSKTFLQRLDERFIKDLKKLLC